VGHYRPVEPCRSLNRLRQNGVRLAIHSPETGYGKRRPDPRHFTGHQPSGERLTWLRSTPQQPFGLQQIRCPSTVFRISLLKLFSFLWASLRPAMPHSIDLPVIIQPAIIEPTTHHPSII
jgi:hypothetical protein